MGACRRGRGDGRGCDLEPHPRTSSLLPPALDVPTMDAVDLRARPDQLAHDDALYGQVMDEQAGLRSSRPPTAAGDHEADLPGYTLMVAGRRTGKTSFLRLLLDTSILSPNVSRDQLASVAKFVQGCSGHTSLVRSVNVNVHMAPADSEESQGFTLTLIDTPSIDFVDDAASQRVVTDILRHVDARFAESIDDVSCFSQSQSPPKRVAQAIFLCRSARRRRETTTYTCECCRTRPE